MPYIDSTPALSPYKVREGTLQNGFKDLLIKNGWTLALEFKRVVTSTHFVTEHDISARHDDSFTVANHQIMRNARGDLLGIAQVAEWLGYTDHANGFPYYNVVTSAPADKVTLGTYMADEFEKRKSGTSLYFYMIEKLPSYLDGSILVTYWGTEAETDKRLQMALDVEVTEVGFKDTTAASSYVKIANPTIMQSPIAESVYRAKFLENLDYPYMETNWWADSELSIKGHIDSNNIFVTIQADNTSMWEDNAVPIVPLYFGDIVPMDEGDPAIILFTGTVPVGDDAETVSKFDFDDSNVLGGKTILPVTKKYPNAPSNGVDNVMVNRTKLGARYQRYSLSWNTAPQEMPPSRSSDNVGTGDGDKDYPRAWDGIKKFQFNPSRYSGKVQTSRVYLVHPEEGVRGYLKRAVGLNASNLNASELRILKEGCPDKVYDVYQCVPVSGVCPLTKRPSTLFRPMGLGLYKNELNLTNPVAIPVNDTTPTAPVTSLQATSLGGGKAAISWVNPADVDFDSIEITVGATKYAYGIREVTSYVLNNLTVGANTISVVAVDLSGNKSTVATVTLTV